MTISGEAIAQAALALVGTRFRLHGRNPATGLDCVGVVDHCLKSAGYALTLPQAYQLRQRHIGSWLEVAERAGANRIDAPLAPGDILLTRPGPAQHHMLVAIAGSKFVHAHAGLRRIVAIPAPLPWPILRQWRLS